jgi:hypothetical protein
MRFLSGASLRCSCNLQAVPGIHVAADFGAPEMGGVNRRSHGVCIHGPIPSVSDDW